MTRMFAVTAVALAALSVALADRAVAKKIYGPETCETGSWIRTIDDKKYKCETKCSRTVSDDINGKISNTRIESTYSNCTPQKERTQMPLGTYRPTQKSPGSSR